MSHRCLRGFVVLVGLGVLAPAGGCGSPSEEGTLVREPDKEQEDIMLKKMGDYMNKHGSPEKTRRTLSDEAKAKKGETAGPDQ